MKLRGSTKVLLALLLLIGGPFYWLLIDNSARAVPAHHLDLAALRAEANRIPGAKPVSIDFEVVGFRRLPRAVMAAGTGIKRRVLGAMAYRLNTPDGPIMINSGYSFADAAALNAELHSAAAQAAVDRAMLASRLILFTATDLDHIGGFAHSPNWPQIAGKALLMPEQMPGSPASGAVGWPRDTSRLRPPVLPVPVQAVAPGVVLIRTSGQSPGSQMIFVQLADGREFLFAGDVAPFARNFQLGRAGSRLLTDWRKPQDRAEQLGWLRAIQALQAADPKLYVVPGHDTDYLLELRGGRPLKYHFDAVQTGPAVVIPTDTD